MRDVGDVHLQVPAAIGTALDVNGVVEIARGFAVNGDDGNAAEIFAAGTLVLSERLGAVLGFVEDLARKLMREMMLADDDFGVDADFAGAAEDFDDAAGGSSAAAWIPDELDVYYGAIEFGEVRDAPATSAAIIGAAEAKFLGEAEG